MRLFSLTTSLTSDSTEILVPTSDSATEVQLTDRDATLDEDVVAVKHKGGAELSFANRHGQGGDVVGHFAGERTSFYFHRRLQSGSAGKIPRRTGARSFLSTMAKRNVNVRQGSACCAILRAFG
jgi:hypothetical protein